MIVFLLVLACLLIRPGIILAIDLSIGSPNVTDNLVTGIASLSGAANNYYLQGTLRFVDSSKYFGETKNTRGEWIDYLSSPEKEFITTNFFVTEIKDASWSGQITMRYKADDPSYKGPGTYEFKLRRYTGSSSSSAGDSNILLVNLVLPLPVPSPLPASVAPSPVPTVLPLASPSPIHLPSPSPSPYVSIVPSPTLTLTESGTVAGTTDLDLSAFGPASPVANPIASTSPLALNRSHASSLIAIGTGLVLVSISGFLFYRKRSGL